MTDTVEIVLTDLNGVPYPDEYPIVLSKDNFLTLAIEADKNGQTLSGYMVNILLSGILSATKDFYGKHGKKNSNKPRTGGKRSGASRKKTTGKAKPKR